MQEMWKPIPEFPNYSISSEGRVRNETRNRVVKLSYTTQGAVKVGLVGPHGQQTRTVKVLVAEAFVEGETEIFNCAIHLDGNQLNNSASNLVWRPRWFAWKYARQFALIDKYRDSLPVVDHNTGKVYSGVIDAATTNGLLFNEIMMSTINRIPTFPTWQMFDWLKEDTI